MDESTIPAVLTEVQADLATLVEWLGQTPDLDLATAETTTVGWLRTVGARLLEVGLAARGTGKAVRPLECPCGQVARFEGYRATEVPMLVG